MNLLRARNRPHLLTVSSSEPSTYCQYACGLGLAGRPGSTAVCTPSPRSLGRNTD